MQRGVSGAAADGKCSVAVVKGCGFPLNLFMACAWCMCILFFKTRGWQSLSFWHAGLPPAREFVFKLLLANINLSEVSSDIES